MKWSKKILVALAGGLLLFAALHYFSRPVRASTSILTGTIKDAQGNPINGYLIMQLPVPAQDPGTGTLISPVPVYFQIVNGAVTGSAPLYDVSTINPGNLYYTAAVYDSSGVFIMGGNYAVTGATFNMGTAVPTVVTTSNISYASPALLGANNVYTGDNTFNRNVSLLGPANIVGAAGLTFNGNASDPGGAAGSLNWRSDLKVFRFFDTAWHTIPWLDGTQSWTGIDTYTQQIVSSLATGTAPFSIASTTLVPNLNVQVLNGVTVSGTPAAGQALIATSPSAASWGGINVPVQVFTNKNLAANVGIVGSTLTTVDSISPTMPAAGGPWRVGVFYNYYMNGGVILSCYVTDGTNSWGMYHATVSSNTATCSNGVAWSPTTYANSANPTFTVKTFNTGASTATTTDPNTAAPSGMQIVVEASN